MIEEMKVFKNFDLEVPYRDMIPENDQDKKIIQERIAEIDKQLDNLNLSTGRWKKYKVEIFFLLKNLEKYLGNGSSMTVASNYDFPFQMYSFDHQILLD